MKFTVDCQSIKEYDPKTGTYLKCNHRIEVDSSQTGTLIQCPHCGHDVEIHNPNMMQSVSDPWLEDETASVAAPEDTEFGLKPLDQPETQNISANADLNREMIDQTHAQPMAPSHFNRSQTCQKCGAHLGVEQTICHTCKAPRPAAFISKPARKRPTSKGPFGFQLWLDSLTTGKKNSSDFEFFAIIAYAAAVLLMGWGFFFLVLAGPVGKLLGLIVGFSGFCFFTGLQYWGKKRKDPRTPTPFLGKMSWLVLLLLCRQFKFNQSREELILNKSGNPDFGDADLAKLEPLKQYKVLDLEGTAISNEGLVFLYEMQGIQFLIIRNTNVTPDAVFELQQAIPKAWIWQ
jgi:DNA-directed RNA polymerase subunit M/transcription elongation factor TFIIS